MDALPLFLGTLKTKGLTKGYFLGFLYVVVGGRITSSDGRLVSAGMTWRTLANWLKKTRWDPEAARELDQDPDTLPPRDRQRFWFTAIAQARLDSEAASRAGERFADVLRGQGYMVSLPPNPSGSTPLREKEQDTPAADNSMK
jgi:hypothetical protein